jgi:hypothetical protein
MQVFSVMAKSAAGSSMYKSRSEADIVMTMLIGREIGLPPMQCLNGGIHNINGKVELSARTMCYMIRRAGHSIKVVKLNRTECVLQGTRCDNGDSMPASFSMEDAQLAGLMSNPTWKKYPEDMLYSRALTRLARRLFADVIGEAYIEGEISGKEPVEKRIAETVAYDVEVTPEPSIEERFKAFVASFPEDQRFKVQRFLEEKAEVLKKDMSYMLSYAEQNREKLEKIVSELK